MNVFTACARLSYFQSLRFLEPAIANVLHAGLGPLTIVAMGAVGWRIVEAGRMSPFEAACQAAMAVCLVAVIAVALAGLSAGEGGVAALIGVAFVSFSGVCITIATLYAKQLHDDGASAAAVVATRFLGGARRCGHRAVVRRNRSARAAVPRRDVSSRSRQRHSSPWRCRSASARSASKLASPLTVRVLLALGPVFLIALPTFVGGVKLSGYSLGGVLAYCAIALTAAFARLFTMRRPRRCDCLQSVNTVEAVWQVSSDTLLNFSLIPPRGCPITATPLIPASHASRSFPSPTCPKPMRPASRR